MKKILFASLVSLFSVLFLALQASGQPPAAETTGGAIRQQIEQEKEKHLDREIRAEKKAAEEKPVLLPSETKGPRVLIQAIKIEGATLVSEADLEQITKKFQGQELTLDGMQSIADEITALYRQKGYVTSRAYLPPQKIKDGVLVIRIVEGKLGQVEIRGNRYFSSSLLKRRMSLEPFGYFDYSALQKSLAYVNEHPDRLAKALLVPGKEPGTTDLIVDVKDRRPFHVSLGYDNYASDYLGKFRYTVSFEHNNLTGHDDRALVKLQYSDGMHLQSQLGRYVYPLSNQWDLGGYFLLSKTDLGKQFSALDSHGKAQVYGLFSSRELAHQEDFEANLNLGFDYKNVKDYYLGTLNSHDTLSVVKLGFDIDKSDPYGRTIFTPEVDVGIPDFLGAMDSKDSDASRRGAGGKFQKYLFNLFRLQPLPFETTLLWKNSAQFTNHSLPAVEQFQIGGPTSVRAYSPAEYSGDKGYATAIEWSLPPYGLSKNIKFPTRPETRLYDAWRFVVFYDLGFVNLKNISAGEQENRTLKGYGFGTRFNVSNDIAIRAEVGFPVGVDSSDGRHAHLWYECIWKF